MTLDPYPFAVAAGGIGAMCVLWIVVQRAWGRAFGMGGQDVLDARGDCGGCRRKDDCELGGTCDRMAAEIAGPARR